MNDWFFIETEEDERAFDALGVLCETYPYLDEGGES